MPPNIGGPLTPRDLPSPSNRTLPTKSSHPLLLLLLLLILIPIISILCIYFHRRWSRRNGSYIRYRVDLLADSEAEAEAQMEQITPFLIEDSTRGFSVPQRGDEVEGTSKSGMAERPPRLAGSTTPLLVSILRDTAGFSSPSSNMASSTVVGGFERSLGPPSPLAIGFDLEDSTLHSLDSVSRAGSIDELAEWAMYGADHITDRWAFFSGGHNDRTLIRTTSAGNGTGRPTVDETVV